MQDNFPKTTNPGRDTSGITEQSFKELIADFFYASEIKEQFPGVKVPPEAENTFIPASKYIEGESDEDWEIRRTAELQGVIPHGCYQLGSGNIHVQTGKGGYIMYLIAMERECRSFKLQTNDQTI
jgi:hypothetical protein